MTNPSYFTHTLPNGLRIIHHQTPSEISYCGIAVNTGTRDEDADEFDVLILFLRVQQGAAGAGEIYSG